MTLEEKLLKIKKDIESKKDSIGRSEGKRDTLLEEIKKEITTEDRQEIRKRIEERLTELDKKEEEFKNGVNKLEEEING